MILDCTEIFIQMLSSFRAQSQTYSSYKSHNTANDLIGIAPNGFVSISNLYGVIYPIKKLQNCVVLSIYLNLEIW